MIFSRSDPKFVVPCLRTLKPTILQTILPTTDVPLVVVSAVYKSLRAWKQSPPRHVVLIHDDLSTMKVGNRNRLVLGNVGNVGTESCKTHFDLLFGKLSEASLATTTVEPNIERSQSALNPNSYMTEQLEKQ